MNFADYLAQKNRQEAAALAPTDAAGLLEARFDAIKSGSYRAVDMPWPSLYHLAKPLLPGSVVVVCGDPGSSKSWMTIQLCWFLIKGGTCNVAMLFMEGDGLFYSTRLLAHTAQNSGLLDDQWVAGNPRMANEAHAKHADDIVMFSDRLDTTGGKPIDYAKIQSWIDIRLAEGCRLLCIDPITHAAPDSKPWVEDKVFVTTAKEKCEKAGASLWIVTHPKSGMKGGTGWDHVAGGAAWGRFCDCVLWLKTCDKGGEQVTVQTGFGVTRIVTCNRKIHLVKCRNGPGERLDIAVNFNKRTMQLEELGVITDDEEEK